MNISSIEIRAEDIPLDNGIIAELAGVNPENIPEPYKSIIQKEIEYANNYINIRGGYVVSENINLLPDEGVFKFEDITFNSGRIILNQLSGSELLAFFICTAGEEVTLRSRQMMKAGYMIEGYIIDAIGSLLVEGAADIIFNRLRIEICRNGIGLTNRYSPGHCNWKLDEQKKLFNLFPTGYCGIRLSESSLMVPLKSLSGVIGIGSKVSNSQYLCDVCEQQNCIYRDIHRLRKYGIRSGNRF